MMASLLPPIRLLFSLVALLPGISLADRILITFPTSSPMFLSESPSESPSAAPSSYSAPVTSNVPVTSILPATVAPVTMAPLSFVPTTAPSDVALSLYPSEAPSVVSALPTNTGSGIAMIALQANVSVVLEQVQSLADTSIQLFVNASQEFFGEWFRLRSTPITNVTVIVSKQEIVGKRQRQLATSASALALDLMIMGNTNDTMINTTSFEDLCSYLVDDKGYALTDLLVATNDPALIKVQSIKTATTAATVTASPSTTVPSTANGNTNNGLSMYAWIGIGVGAGALLVLLLAMVRYRRGGNATDSNMIPTTVMSSSNNNNNRAPPPLTTTSSLISDVPSSMENTTLNNMDNMSYAYSLDHGIGDSESLFDQGTVESYSTLSRGMPSEIGNTISTSDAMTKTRECWAPPGKLGIVIDTSINGPVVHRVNAGSPLEGVLWPGDIIVAINDVDTKSLSASAITSLMAKNMNQRRRLTVLSAEG